MLKKQNLIVIAIAACLWGAVSATNAESISIGMGDMIVATGGSADTDLGYVYHVTASGTKKTLLGTFSRYCAGVAIDTDGTILVAGKSMGLYRIDTRNYTPTSSGTALNITGASFSSTCGIEVGSTGTIFVSATNSSSIDSIYRLAQTAANDYSASAITTLTDGTAWPIAIKSDSATAEIWGNRGAQPNNVYQYTEGGGTRTKLNSTTLSGNAFSKAYDADSGILYVGSTNSSSIAAITTSTGVTRTNIIVGTNPFGSTSGVRGMELYDGALYAVNSMAGGGIYTINTATGEAQQLGIVAFDEMPRGVVVCSIPEPATGVLCCLGIVSILLCAWRKGKRDQVAPHECGLVR